MAAHTDIKTGLTSEQVAALTRDGQVNTQPPSVSKSTKRIVRDNLCTFFNALNLAIAICILLVGHYKNLLFIGIVLANTAIGIIQELRSKHEVEKLSVLSAPKATVVRDGKTQSIPCEQLVRGDVMVLRLGFQVCADAVILDGDVEVDESLLTGESDPVSKHPGDTLLSGSFILSGCCFGEVQHIGEENYAVKITQQARKHKKINSELMRSLNKIIRFAGIFIIPLGLLLFAKTYFLLGSSLGDSVVSAAAAMIGMIPEGLVLLTSVALAVGVIKLARQKTLVKELYCIETLARVDVLCLDKTGTLTEGRMEVSSCVPLKTDCDPSRGIGLLLSALDDENPTFLALRARFSAVKGEACFAKAPFSSARKWSGASFAEGSYLLGAPEFILSKGDPVLQTVSQYADAGQRVLLLAHSGETLRETSLPSSLEPLALILLEDKIRPEAKATLDFFMQQGVSLKIISGDNPHTAANVAARAGFSNADSYIDASTLTTDKALAEAAEKYAVFGRVSPAQKRSLILALKAAGHTVAMTGDGVNDVPALKEADCSIAMAAGNDAARQVSQLVLLDSNFASMPKVVMEGRRVINNIMRTSSLFLVKTIFSFLLSLITLFLAYEYPFAPIQLTLISSLTVGIPAFFMALEPNSRRIQGSFISNVLQRAIPGALTIVINILALTALAAPLGINQDQLSTIIVYITGFTGLLILLRVSLPFTKLRAALLILMTVAFFTIAWNFPDLFMLVPFTSNMYIVLGVAMALAYPILFGLTRLFSKSLSFLRNIKDA